MDDRKRPDPKDQTSTERLPAAPVPVRPPSSRGVTLVVFHQTETYTAQLDPGRALVIGRKAPSDIVVDDDNLSRQHARFSLADGRITVEDPRPHVMGDRVDEHHGTADAALARTGQMPHASAPSAILAWVRDHEQKQVGEGKCTEWSGQCQYRDHS